MYRRVDEGVVGRDAGLPGVEALAHDDPLGREIEVGGGGDDDRALAAELERDERQMLGARLRDDAPDLGAAGKEDVVPLAGQQRLGDLDTAFEHRDEALVERLAHEVGDHGRRRRRELGRLDHRDVACRERGDERRDRQVHRVVPRADDQVHAQRLVVDVAGRRRGDHRREAGALVLHPLAELLERVLELVGDEADLGDV